MASYFSQVTIIGVGLLGGSMALALKKYKLTDRVVGISRPETLQKAQSLGVIDDGVSYDELEKGIGKSKVIFLTTPIYVIISLMERLAPLVEDGVIVTDVGSTKKNIMEAAASRFTGRKIFIGGHPMAGSEYAGVEKADPDLYVNRPYVLIPAPSVTDAYIDRLEYAVKCIGAKTVRMSAEEHDTIAAAVSHVPQLAAVALMNVIGRKDAGSDKYFQLAAGGLRDMTRIASSPFSIWEDICSTNKESIQKAIRDLIAELHEINNLVGTSDLGEKFRCSAEFRKQLTIKFPVNK